MTTPATDVEVIRPEVVRRDDLVAASSPRYEVELSARDLEMIRRQVNVPDGTRPPSNQEVEDFGRYCMALRLNPFDAHIYLMPIGGRWRPFPSVHGRLVIAYRTGEVTGMEGPYYCHERTPEQRARREPPDWDELWDEDEPPHAAKFVVYRRGLDPVPVGTAPWRYYAFDTGKDGARWRKKGLWVTNPPLILGYKAITRALSLTFRDIMPPAPERDEPDIDESLGYSRDVPPGEAGPGAAATEAGNPVTTPRPGPRTSFVVPTREQAERIHQLRARAPALADRTAWLEYVSQAVGWVVTDTRDLDRADTDDLIWRLEADLAAATEPPPPEPEEP